MISTPPFKISGRDLSASLVVFLVAVPLSLGIALASGAPILGGLIGAAVGGIVVGLLGGAPLQVSGPAAGLTVLVFGIVQKFGYPTACAIFAIAGLIQLALGFLKVARVSLAISPAVVHGMLAGIGVVITLAQLHVVLGDSPQSSAIQNLKDLPGEIANLHGASTALGLFAIAILIAWNFVPKSLKKVPGPLVAVIVPTLVSLGITDPELRRVDLPANLVPQIALPSLPQDQLAAIAVAALTIAIVASIESLLSAVATDAMHGGQKADLDRELLGQGAGNLISGLLGGLPVTGVIVRSSANIAAGAQTRWSAILHGVWVVVFVAIAGALIEKIPLAVLAGLLVYVGTRLVNIHHIRALRTHGEIPAYAVTLVGVVGKDLLFGVGAGIVVAMILLLRRMSRVRITEHHLPGLERIEVDGSLTFLSVPKLTTALDKLSTDVPVEVHLHTDFMDHAAFEALHAWVEGRDPGLSPIRIIEHHDDWYSTAVDDNPLHMKSSPSDAKSRRTEETTLAPF